MEFEPRRLIQKFKSKTETNVSVMRKGIYYSSPASPWIALACCILISAIVIPLAILIEGNKASLLAIYGLFVGFEVILLLFLYFLSPWLYCRKNKKNPIISDVMLYDDSYQLILSENKTINGFETKETNRLTMFFSTVIMAKKDEHAFYFVFKNEKHKRVCVIIDDDEELSKDSRAFLLEQVEKRKKKKKS